MIINFQREQIVLPKKEITNITIERDIQTIIRFYKNDKILKELNHIYLNHEQFVNRLRKLDYPVEDRTEKDDRF